MQNVGKFESLFQKQPILLTLSLQSAKVQNPEITHGGLLGKSNYLKHDFNNDFEMLLNGFKHDFANSKVNTPQSIEKSYQNQSQFAENPSLSHNSLNLKPIQSRPKTNFSKDYGVFRYVFNSILAIFRQGEVNLSPS